MALIPYIIFAVLMLVAALVGFIFIQLKAHPYWRVTSLALVVGFVLGLVGFITRKMMLTRWQIMIEGRTISL
jgi:uncharacterized protein YneF (UPF0154 family)